MVVVLSGRGLELAELGPALSSGRPILVAGEAGIGKTTLLRVAAEATGARVFEGGALATLSWLAFLPLSRALGRELTGVDAQAVAHEVQQAVGAEGLLLLDDLQWAAPATWEVVGLLAGRVPLALGARPEATSSVPDALTDAGLLTLDLGPLDAGDAERLAREIRPTIGEDALSHLLRRAGGSPLLIRELAATPEPTPTLRRVVGARLRALADADRTAFGLLALAGRALPAEALGEEVVTRLVAADLVDRDDDRVDLRHALLGEVAIEDLEADVRRDLHARLGRLLSEPGEAARHLDHAGDRAGSRRLALVAARSARLPGERASHLRLAAVNSDERGADSLRLDAAEALEAAHDWDGVFSVLEQVTGTEPGTVARASLVRARAAWSGARLDDLQPALDAGLAAVGGTGSPLEVLLHVEACRVPIFLGSDLDQAIALARDAFAEATAAGVGEARAAYFLGTALAIADDPEGPRRLEQAVADARATGEVSTELTAANNLVSFHESSGSPGLAADLARQMVGRSRELGLGYWEAGFTYQVLQLDFHAGHYDGLLDRIADLAARPLDPRSRDALLEVQCLTLVDLGRPDEATTLAGRAMAGAADAAGGVHFWWALAEAALASGRPARALECAEAYLAGLPEGNPNDAFGWVSRAWAQLELRVEPAVDMPPTDRPMLFAVPHELAGLGAAHEHRYADAARELDAAAGLWAPYHRRGELRCAWGAAEMLRLDGRPHEAVEALTAVEERAADVGLTAVVHRAQRSLRAAGLRRARPRSAGPEGLTGREREVLALVAQGLTNDQVATRLGVTRRTVVTQIEAAMTKLGAENRLQAAVLAALLEAGETP